MAAEHRNNQHLSLLEGNYCFTFVDLGYQCGKKRKKEQMESNQNKYHLSPNIKEETWERYIGSIK